MPVENNGNEQAYYSTTDTAKEVLKAAILDGIKEPKLETEQYEWYTCCAPQKP